MVKRRYYEVSVQRLCGEFVCGRVSAEFWAYWKDRDGLDQHVFGIGYDEERDADSPPMLPSGEDPEGWYAVDDIVHMNNAVLDGNYIHVDEVEPSEESYSGFRFKPDGYSEVFSIDEVCNDMSETLIQRTRSVEVDPDEGAADTPVFVGKSIEKGAQTVVIVETIGDFDLSKLSFETWHIDGDEVIASVWYDGVECENQPDSSDGRAFYAYVGELTENSRTPLQMGALSTPDLNSPSAATQGRGWIWTFVFLAGLVAAAALFWRIYAQGMPSA